MRRATKPPTPFPLLSLPESVRVKIWNTLGFSHTKTLRLVCSRIKQDIDTLAGISSAIDSTFEDFPFHSNIAIRKLAVHELITPRYVEFLKYPMALHELEIRGEISTENFNYIIKSCPNITKFLILFNKFVTDQATPMFPLAPDKPKPGGDKNKAPTPTPKPFGKLTSIKLISTTKKVTELTYVHRMILGLLAETVPKECKIESLQILMSHKGPHILFLEVMMTSMLFLHRHAGNLRYLNLMFRDRDPHAVEAVGHGHGPNPSHQAPTSDDPKTTPAPTPNKPGAPATEERKDSTIPQLQVTPPPVNLLLKRTPKSAGNPPSAPGATQSPTPVPHHKDVHIDVEPKEEEDTDKPELPPEGEGEAELSSGDSDERLMNDKILQCVRYLDRHPWPCAHWLHYLILSAPYRVLEYVLHILSSSTRLATLNLEAIGSHLHHSNNWNLYKEFLIRSNVRNLKSCTFHHVSNENAHGQSGHISFKLFHNCRSLQKLTVLSERKDDFGQLSRAEHVGSLPNSLREIHLERLLLTPCQVLNLVFCFTAIREINLFYWSITDCQFRFLMGMLKHIIRLEMTDCRIINLVDTKIRFKNNRKAVRGLQHALEVSSKYQDLDDTRLMIDTKDYKKGERGYAPRLSIVKVKRQSQDILLERKARRRKKGETRSSIVSLGRLKTNASQVSIF